VRHEVLRRGGKTVVRMLCGGCRSGEGLSRCMRHAVEAILEHPETDEIVMEGVCHREYSGEAMAALRELADFVRALRTTIRLNLTSGSCRRCEGKRREELGRILREVPSDPKGALMALRKMVSDVRSSGARIGLCTGCRKRFAEILSELAAGLEGCRVIRGPVAARLRPPFSHFVIDLEVPPGFLPVRTYAVGEDEVKIFWSRERLRHLYFLLPLEHRMSARDVELISLAKTRLIGMAGELPGDLRKAREVAGRMAEEILAELATDRDAGEIRRMAGCLARMTAGLGVLDILLADPLVQDVYVDAPVGETPVHVVHADFGECLTNIYVCEEGIEGLVSKFRLMSGRPFSEAFPVLDLDLGGSRCTAIGPPLSQAGISLALRRHRSDPWTLSQLVARDFMSPEAAALLSLLVDARGAILVTGHRGAGKTSLLTALMLETPPGSRVITIEDTPELPVAQMRRMGFEVLSMVVQPSVAGSGYELRAEDALRAALRLGESVIVIGEVRGPEAGVLYEAMRVGTAGSAVMGTIHGSSARDVFERVVLDLGIPASSFRATDVIAVVSTVREGGRMAKKRRLTEITEVKKSGEPEFTKLLSYDRESGEFRLNLRGSDLLRRTTEKWGMSLRDLLENLRLRESVFRETVRMARELPGVLEAGFTVMASLKWRELLEDGLSPGRVFREWRSWLIEEVGNRKTDSTYSDSSEIS
jgi:flagellar protein FlaI